MRSAPTVAALLALTAFTGRAEQTKFDAPRANGYRVDACRSWGQGCGKEAADAFCRLHSYQSAAAFEIDPGIGVTSPTMTIEDRKICNQPQCGGFKWITCARPDGAPGRRPGVPPIGRPPGNMRVPPPTAPPPSPAPATPAPRDPPSRVPPAR